MTVTALRIQLSMAISPEERNTAHFCIADTYGVYHTLFNSRAGIVDAYCTDDEAASQLKEELKKIHGVTKVMPLIQPAPKR